MIENLYLSNDNMPPGTGINEIEVNGEALSGLFIQRGDEEPTPIYSLTRKDGRYGVMFWNYGDFTNAFDDIYRAINFCYETEEEAVAEINRRLLEDSLHSITKERGLELWEHCVRDRLSGGDPAKWFDLVQSGAKFLRDLDAELYVILKKIAKKQELTHYNFATELVKLSGFALYIADEDEERDDTFSDYPFTSPPRERVSVSWIPGGKFIG